MFGCRPFGFSQGKTKGQQLKGKIVSYFFALFGTFWHFFRIFPPGLSPSKQRVLAQGEQTRRKDNKRKRANRFCTLVVARLSSSYFRRQVRPSSGPGWVLPHKAVRLEKFTPVGWGSFTRRGGGRKVRALPPKVCLPWVSKRGIWDVPGIFAGMSRTPGGVQKVCAKKFARIFRSLHKAVRLENFT